MIKKLWCKLFGIKEKEPFLKIGDRAWHRYTPQGFCEIKEVMTCREGRVEGYLIKVENYESELFVENYSLCKIVSQTDKVVIFKK
jgi:hypothetical protein